MRSMRTCITWNWGTIREITVPTDRRSAGMLTRRMSVNGPSSRTAKMTPPMMVNGAASMSVHVISTRICTCWTSLVIRVINDGAPNRATSWAEKSVTWWNRACADVAAERHRDASAEVDRGDREHHLHQRDGEHEAADAPDVVGVSRQDTLVDDVRIERWEEQRAQHLHEGEREHQQQRSAVGAEESAEQPDQHSGDRGLVTRRSFVRVRNSRILERLVRRSVHSAHGANALH